MKTLRIRNLTLGEGQPKICVPIVGRTLEDILIQAREALRVRPDMIEWRVDHFLNVRDLALVREAAHRLRKMIPDMPLLFTFRTLAEGGQTELPIRDYFRLAQEAVCSLPIDLIDLELFTDEEAICKLLSRAHARDIKVLLSNHDFEKTPTEEELFTRLKRMEALGCDIAKIAVMPKTPADVLRLLAVTERFHEEADCVVVTMSMSRLGLISRLCGSLTGSALTFGSAAEASAPGQIPADRLRSILETF